MIQRIVKSLITIFSLILVHLSGMAQCSQEELEYLIENSEEIAAASQDCAFECIFSFNQDQCIINCLSEQFDLSESCLQCNAQQVACVLDNCAFACINSESDNCQDCIQSSCMPNYFWCIGDPDMDGYLPSAGDCDNNDPTIYPGAVEIADDGIDQDCDGFDLQTPTRVDEDQKLGLRFFPDRITWESGVALIEIFDISGRMLHSFDASNSNTFFMETLPGVRLIRVSAFDGDVVSRKMVF